MSICIVSSQKIEKEKNRHRKTLPARLGGVNRQSRKVDSLLKNVLFCVRDLVENEDDNGEGVMRAIIVVVSFLLCVPYMSVPWIHACPIDELF